MLTAAICTIIGPEHSLLLFKASGIKNTELLIVLLKDRTSFINTALILAHPYTAYISYSVILQIWWNYMTYIILCVSGRSAISEKKVPKWRVVFNIHRNIWSSKHISINTKIIIFNTNVKQVMRHESETWRRTTHKQAANIHTCLRRILKIW